MLHNYIEKMEDYKRDPYVCGFFCIMTFGKQPLGREPKNHLIIYVEVLCTVFFIFFCHAAAFSLVFSFSYLIAPKIIATSAHIRKSWMLM